VVTYANGVQATTNDGTPLALANPVTLKSGEKMTIPVADSGTTTIAKKITLSGGTLAIPATTNGSSGTVNVNADIDASAGGTLSVGANTNVVLGNNAKLTVPSTATLTLTGSVEVKSGTEVDVPASLNWSSVGNGTVKVDQGGTVKLNTGSGLMDYIGSTGSMFQPQSGATVTLGGSTTTNLMTIASGTVNTGSTVTVATGTTLKLDSSGELDLADSTQFSCPGNIEVDNGTLNLGTTITGVTTAGTGALTGTLTIGASGKVVEQKQGTLIGTSNTTGAISFQPGATYETRADATNLVTLVGPIATTITAGDLSDTTKIVVLGWTNGTSGQPTDAYVKSTSKGYDINANVTLMQDFSVNAGTTVNVSKDSTVTLKAGGYGSGDTVYYRGRFKLEGGTVQGAAGAKFIVSGTGTAPNLGSALAFISVIEGDKSSTPTYWGTYQKLFTQSNGTTTALRWFNTGVSAHKWNSSTTAGYLPSVYPNGGDIEFDWVTTGSAPHWQIASSTEDAYLSDNSGTDTSFNVDS
jgi:hypothetical protein